MDKSAKSAVALSVIVAFFSALFVCYVFPDTPAFFTDRCAHAKAARGLAHATHGPADSHAPDTCMCRQNFIADFSGWFNGHLVTAKLLKRFFENDMAQAWAVRFLFLRHALLVPERPPPLAAFVSIPFFLRDSNFRI